MLGDSDLFDAIMDISVTAARDAAPSLGISSAQADELGKKIGLRLGADFYHRFAGAQVYISGRSLCRNKLLMAAFTGHNHNELARIFHITSFGRNHQKNMGSSLRSRGWNSMKQQKKIGEGVKFERIRRITGYLVGTVDRFNDAKRAEVEDRVKHIKFSK